MKTLSIIVPIYNVEKYLNECLQSIVGIDDIEIILINDCTPDNSIEIAEFYVKKYQNIKLIHHKVNKGLGAARNTGIDNANGKYIFFLDSDDHLDTAKLKSLIKTLKETEHEQVIISFLRFDEEQGIWSESNTRFYKKYNNKILNKSNFKTLINLINISPIRIIKREKILSDNLRFPNGLYEDVIWSYWFAYSCITTLVIDNRIYYYRQHSQSILGAMSSRHMELIEQQKKTLELFKSKSVSLKTLSILDQQFIKHLKHVLFKTERIPNDLRIQFSKHLMDKIDSLLLSKTNKIKQIDNAIINLVSIKFLVNPIKKIKAYKQLIKIYYTQRGI